MKGREVRKGERLGVLQVVGQVELGEDVQVKKKVKGALWNGSYGRRHEVGEILGSGTV